MICIVSHGVWLSMRGLWLTSFFMLSNLIEQCYFYSTFYSFGKLVSCHAFDYSQWSTAEQEACFNIFLPGILDECEKYSRLLHDGVTFKLLVL